MRGICDFSGKGTKDKIFVGWMPAVGVLIVHMRGWRGKNYDYKEKKRHEKVFGRKKG